MKELSEWIYNELQVICLLPIKHIEELLEQGIESQYSFDGVVIGEDIEGIISPNLINIEGKSSQEMVEKIIESGIKDQTLPKGKLCNILAVGGIMNIKRKVKINGKEFTNTDSFDWYSQSAQEDSELEDMINDALCNYF